MTVGELTAAAAGGASELLAAAVMVESKPELEEILALSDRIAVMFDGRIMGERLPAETDEKELGLLMAGITDTKTEHSVEEIEENLAHVGERGH